MVLILLGRQADGRPQALVRRHSDKPKESE